MADGYRSADSGSGYRSFDSGGGGRIVGGGKKKDDRIFGLPYSDVLTHAATDLKDITYNVIPGAYYTAKAIADAAQGNTQPLKDIAKGTVTQVANDFRHPLRHPGYTLLDIASLSSLGLGAAARFTEASRLAAAGETAAAQKVILRGFRDTSQRTVKYNEGLAEVGQWSKSAGTRIIQRRLDSLRQRFPTYPILGKSLEGRINFHLAQQAHLFGAEKSAPAQALTRYKEPFSLPHVEQGVKVGGKQVINANPTLAASLTKRVPILNRMALSTPEQVAVRLVGEQTPIGERIPYEGRQIEKGFGMDEDHRRNIKLLEIVKARGYVVERAVPREGDAKILKQLNQYQIQYPDNSLSKMFKREQDAKAALTRFNKKPKPVDHVVEINPKYKKLAKAVELAREVANHREQAMIQAGELTQAEAYARKIAPLQEIRNELAPVTKANQEAKLIGPPAVAGQGRLFILEDVAPGGKFSVGNPDLMFRVPYSNIHSRTAMRPVGVPREGHGNVQGAKTKPESFEGDFTGMLMRTGNYRHDVIRMIAETDLEAQRFLSLMHFKNNKILPLSKPTPAGMRDPVLIRTEEMAGKSMTDAQRGLVNKTLNPEAHLSSDEILALGTMYDDFRKKIFYDKSRMNTIVPRKGDRYIEKKVVKDFMEPGLLSSVAQNSAGGKALATADVANNAMRMGYLYLKPAYAIPNLLGNAALLMFQQGFLAPIHLRHSFKIFKQLTPVEGARIDAIMGEGAARAMASGGAGGWLGQSTEVAARSWSALIDTPFRRSSFIHEAKVAGYDTLPKLKKLLSDEGNKDELIRIGLNGNKDLVDFARLGNGERAVARRVFFFYPWLKGSSVLAGRMVTEHPAITAASGALGKEGTSQVHERLGVNLPSYLQGYFPVGGTKAHPTMINPAALSLFQTPGQVAETVVEKLTGNSTPGFQPLSLFNPQSEALVAGLTGVNQFTGQRIQSGLLQDTWKSVTGGMALPLLKRRLTEDQSQKLFPMSSAQALEQFLIGITPRTTSRARIYQAEKRETQ